ncbi:MAG: ABC transporter ATP-binding protein [Phycisphaerae bacterium]|nr:ABC transporter ATP-binding protein [Phycisphaerae bacterium]MCZ2398967.1 ABC transporter ATP-binding protein [Phycisphaerae bacterium]
MLLTIENLRTVIAATGVDGDGPAAVVDGVSLSLAAGGTAALVGESGSGKTLTALSIMRLLPESARLASGRVIFEGRDLVTATEAELRRIRGVRAAMIFQEPMTSLNPVLTVGFQIAEPLRVHRGMSRPAARREAIELLRRVGIPAPQRRVDAHPHELSGGMRQRAMIAMALACRPALLVADEPTTALDATVQAQIMALLGELRRQTGLALLLITHDLRLVARVADDVHIMYAGRIVESGPVAEVLGAPRHPYTAALLRTLPGWGGDAARGNAPLGEPRRARLPVIPGEPAHAHRRPGGCAFHPRCEVGKDDARCRAEVPPVERRGARSCACFKELSSERVGALV